MAADEVVVTGSLLPRQISDDGDLPLSSSPLGVLTAEQIQRLGAANLSQALSRGIPTPR